MDSFQHPAIGEFTAIFTLDSAGQTRRGTTVRMGRDAHGRYAVETFRASRGEYSFDTFESRDEAWNRWCDEMGFSGRDARLATRRLGYHRTYGERWPV